MAIKDIRMQTGLSQSKFAGKLGVPLRTLQQWEQGRSNPPDYVESLIQYAVTAFDTTPTPKISPIDKSDYVIAPRDKWKVCIDRPFENCDRVYPLQQRKIRELLDCIKDNPSVRSVTIFGSSVTERCHMGSDVDVFVKLDGDGSMLNSALSSLDFEYDLWTDSSVDERLKREIEESGVVVYG